MKKITKATFKSFVRKNSENLLVNKLTSFDCMVDCVMPNNEGFELPDRTDWARRSEANTLGIRQLWIVNRPGADFFERYEDEKHIGIRYDNCTGSGVVAVLK